jgi:hypothetical protein
MLARYCPHRVRGLTYVLVPLVLVFGMPWSAAGQATYALFPVLDGQGTRAKIDANLTQTLQSASATALGKTQMIAPDALEKALGISPVKALQSCGDDIMCVAQLGTMLSVRFLVIPRVEKSGGKRPLVKLMLALIDVNEARLLRQSTIEGADEAQLGKNISESIFAFYGIATKGELVVKLPAGTKCALFIDGNPTQLKKDVVEVSPGHHEVVVQVEGFQSWRTAVALAPGKRTSVVPELVPELSKAQAAQGPAHAGQPSAAGAVSKEAPSRFSPWDIIGYSALGGAGLCAIIALVEGGRYLQQSSKASGELEQIAAGADRDTALSAARGAYISWGVAGVLGAAGLAILLRGYYLPAGTTAAIVPTPDGSGVYGSVTYRW